MNKYMILCAVGKNRLGIVDDVTTFLLGKNTNIEDSRMVILGGRFSIMCLFSCSKDGLQNIKDDIGSLHKIGLKTTLHEADSPGSLTKEDQLPLTFEVISMDHPGIIQSFVHILKEHNVCIQSLDTQMKPMPHCGAPLFDLKMKADVPTEQSIAKVKEELNNLASELNLDLTFSN